MKVRDVFRDLTDEGPKAGGWNRGAESGFAERRVPEKKRCPDHQSWMCGRGAPGGWGVVGSNGQSGMHLRMIFLPAISPRQRLSSNYKQP